MDLVMCGRMEGERNRRGVKNASEVGLSWWPLNRIFSSKKPVTSLNGNARVHWLMQLQGLSCKHQHQTNDSLP
jgi:hypothetical protein